jgi:outer membrane lipoprotein-sorting protein
MRGWSKAFLRVFASSRLRVLVCSIPWLMSACARAPRAPEAPSSPLPALEVSALLDDLRRQEESVRRYQGLVRVRGRSSEGSFDARLAVWFERPDRLRVELLGAFGGTRWSAVAIGAEITAYFPSKNQYVREPDVAEVVARLLGVRLRPEDMMAALSGSGLSLGPSSTAEGWVRGSLRVLEIASPAGSLDLDGEGQVVAARCESYRVAYPGSWKSRGRLFPNELTLENDSVRARLETSEVDVNVDLDPGTFALAIPDDAARLRPAEVGAESVFVVGRERP